LKCFFINLDDATARRARLEADFAALAPASWSLQRFRAVTAGDVLAAQCPGELRPVEKACFLSHRRLIEQNEGSSSPLFILEDDAKLGRHTARMLNEFLGANPHLAWDLLYTDVIVPEIGDVVNLIRTRRECEQQRGIALINLERLRFGGATAYLVNSRSLGKLARLLREEKSLDCPYDIFLRRLIVERKLTAHVLFPFLTTVAADVGGSQIQPAESATTELVWDTFRTMMWFERDSDQVTAALNRLRAQVCDEESAVYGPLLSAYVSRRFLQK
jgi:GR25 family glycosyltransferase involved in LPS biosynthesis